MGRRIEIGNPAAGGENGDLYLARPTITAGDPDGHLTEQSNSRFSEGDLTWNENVTSLDSKFGSQQPKRQWSQKPEILGAATKTL